VQIPDVPPQLLAALRQAAGDQRLALVGGVVRDLLLHRQHQDPWRGLPDLDLVVEGSAAALMVAFDAALAVQMNHPMEWREQHHGAYGTVAVEVLMPQTLQGQWLLDLASARTELYPVPAANPVVRSGSLEQDLARRDFTVNAMALIIGPHVGEAELLDPHHGQMDLQARQLRFLHAGSLRDDPTRLFRAARYAARLGFELAPESLEMVQTTLADWPWPWRCGDPPEVAPPGLATRLRMELELLLNREPWQEALALLQRWGGLSLLDPRLQEQHDWMGRLCWAKRLALPLLPALVANSQDPHALASRLQLPHGQRQWLRDMFALEERLLSAPLPNSPSGWTECLERPGCSVEGVALALVRGLQPRRPLVRWWYRWRHVRSPRDARQVMATEGLVPGPSLGQRLKDLRMAHLDQLG